MYADEMTRPFRHTDPAMPEENKVRFLMRGVKEELFAEYVRKPPETVSQFVYNVATIEKALELRTRQYNCHSRKTNDAEAQAQTI